MLGEGERTQRTRMRQSRDDSGCVVVGESTVRGGGDVRTQTGGGEPQSRFVKQREEVVPVPVILTLPSKEIIPAKVTSHMLIVKLNKQFLFI